MNYLNPILVLEKWTRNKPANNFIISFFCLFLLLLVGKLEAQSSLICPADFQVSAASNQCGAVVDFSVGSIENCSGATVTQSADNQSVTMALSCGDGSQHIRVFDVNALGSGPLAIQSIDVGIGYAAPGSTITLNYYTLSGPVDYANMTLIGSQPVTLPALFNSIHNIPVSVTAPAGSVFVVEVVAPAGPNSPSIGYNMAGETNPSYYASGGPTPDGPCGQTNLIEPTSLGFGDFHLIMTLNTDPLVTITQTSGLPSGSIFPVGVTTNVFTITDLCGANELCGFNVTVVDDFAPLLTCPVVAPIYLAAGQCDAAVTWNLPTIADNCTGASIVTSSHNSGDIFPAGTTTVTYEATDASGNGAICSFDVTVIGAGNTGGAFACSNGINLPLGPNCEVQIDALTLLLSGYDCNANYNVYAVDAAGNIIGDIIDGSYVGQTLQVIVADQGVNKCWGTVTIEDYVAPTIDCSDITILCNDDYDVASIGEPNAYDACGSVSLTYTDQVDEFGCFADFLKVIERTWVATDKAGNTASCVQTISLAPISIADVVFPDNFDTFANPHIECGGAEDTDPAITGYPEINGKPIDNGDLCGLSIDYSDSIYELCGGSYKVVRTWTVLEWCTNATVTNVQTIKVLDKVAPVLSCPSVIQIPTAANACSATFLIPSITVTDACSDVSVSVTIPNGFVFDMNGGAGINLELGTHTLIYTATDACNNFASCSLTIEVFDNVPPVAVCDANTTVSLDQTGQAQVCATTLDDGSYDNCADVVVKVKRMDAPASAPYTDCVAFDCSDIGAAVMVNMRVYDVVGTFDDNDPTARYNECTVEVYVADNISPTIQCPSDVTLDCEQDPTDHTLTGTASGADVCGVSQLSYTDEDNRDQCGVGTVVRTYVVGDLNDNPSVACIQTITFVDNTPIVVEFPNDYEALNCAVTGSLIPENLPAGFSTPIITGDNCELISVNYTDELFVQDPAACFQIHREWKVVEWCKFDSNDPSEPGVTRHTQVITLTDNVAPQITTGCEDEEFCSYDSNCHSGNAVLFFQATDDCLMPELLHYRYEIDLYSDGAVDVSANSAVATADYPLGVHLIEFIVTDGCGNTDRCTKQFTITDCKKPTPVCINGLAVDLMPSIGEVSIQPLDFESGSSFDNCTPQSDLIFSFSSDVNDQVKTFTCLELGTQIVELWVTDENGNQDFCQTYIIVQDNNNTCQVSQNAEIAGHIETEDQDLVEAVDVQIMNSNALPYTTSADGQFVFPSILLNNNYTVHPEKVINPLNGVTTLDLVFMQQHILGVSALNSPYKIIAADVNKSNSVTTLDIVALQRLILGVDQDFQTNTSWRFVDMDYVFADPTNPFATIFPEEISYNGISADELATDFVGVKIGDVNGTAIPNALLGSQVRNFNGSLTFDLENEVMVADETYTVDFKSSDFREVYGYQFTIDFDASQLEMMEVVPGALSNLTETNFGLTNAQDGIITTSWSAAKATTMDADEVLFSIKFKSLNEVSLNKVLAVSSKATKAESYNANMDLMNVAFNFNNTNTATTFEVFQNQPNPFTDATSIAFNLPQANEVTLTISDVSGKVLKVITGDYAQGYNEIAIDANDLNGSGVMMYRLDSGDFTATKKMITIK